MRTRAGSAGAAGWATSAAGAAAAGATGAALAATGAAELLPALAGADADGGAGLHARPREKQQATLRLDWVVIGNNSMYYLALDKGFYAGEGLDVEIGPGQGSGSTSQVVGGGKDMFGIADVGTAALAIGRGVPITVI